MRYMDENGGVAQLGEHLNGIQGVRGSNPLISTSFGIFYKKLHKIFYKE